MVLHACSGTAQSPARRPPGHTPSPSWRADGRGVCSPRGRDELSRHAVSHEAAGQPGWEAGVSGWLGELAARRGGGYAYKDEGCGHCGGERPGTGAMLAAGAAGPAAGAVGGLVAAGLLDVDDRDGDES